MRSLLTRLALATTCVALYLVLAASFRANPPGAANLVGAFVVLTFAVFVLCKGPRMPLNRAFFWLGLCLTSYILLVYLLHMATSVGIKRVERAVQILRYGLLLAPMAMTGFTYRFVDERNKYLRALPWIALLSMSPFIVLNLTGRYITEYRPLRWTFVPAGNLRAYALSSIFTICWALACGVIVLAQCFRASQRARRGRFVLFLIGWAPAVGHAFLGYLPAFKRLYFPSMTGVTWAAFPTILGVAVARFNLFDIKVVIRRTLPYAIGTGLIGGLYAASLAALRALGARLDFLPGGTEWVSFLILMGLAFQPVLEGLQRGLDHLFFRTEAELDRFLAEAGVRYREAKSRKGLALRLAGDARDVLKLEGAAVLLGGEAVSQVYSAPQEAAWQAAVGLPLPEEAKTSASAVIDEDARPRQDAGSRTLSAALVSAGARLSLPFGQGETRGLLVCKQKLSHLAFTQRDRIFLAALTAQVDTAFSRLDARQDADALQRLTEAIFESMTSAVVVVDEGQRVQDCNPAFTDLFAEPAGKTLRELGIPEVLAPEGPTPRELSTDRGTFLVSSKALDGEAGAGKSVVVLMDVTELRRFQEADRRRAALAEIGATVSSINHELGNIISPLNHYIESARRADDPERVRRCLESARERIRSMERLSRELRSYYREPELSPRRGVVRDIVESALSDVGAAVGEGWIPPDLQGLDLAIWADLQKTKQVFVNLVKNAWEAMAESPHKTWSINACREDDRVAMTVRDCGPGIPPASLKRLFEPFFTTKKERGTGLGLAIVQRIVEAHGAEIRAASSPTSGTTFILSWPPAD